MHRSWSLIAPLTALVIAAASPVWADAPAAPVAAPAKGAIAARPRQQHVLVLYSPPRHAAVTVWEDAFHGALTRGSSSAVAVRILVVHSMRFSSRARQRVASPVQSVWKVPGRSMRS